MIYLDNAATTTASAACAEAVLKTMREDYFNPASPYSPAVQVELDVEQVRRDLAKFLCHKSKDIIFTSGGTESDNIAILGTHFAQRHGIWRYVCGPTEHPAVYECFRALARLGQEVVFLHCDENGAVDLQEMEYVVDEKTVLVSIMHVNNEFGSMTDLQAVAGVIRKKNPNTLLHSDGVQAVLHLESMRLPVDLYSVSAHKFHGPKGSGALLRGDRCKTIGQLGGGQEGNKRSGTLNSPGILGMGAALTEGRNAFPLRLEQMKSCRSRLAQGLRSFPDVLFNGPQHANAAPHILNVSIMGVRGEVMLHALEERDILVGTGSACASKKQGDNRVLAAIAVTGKRADSAIRFSFSHMNTLEEVDILLNHLEELIPLLRKFQPR